MKFMDDADVRYLLDYATQNGRDFHLSITANGDVDIDVAIPTNYMTKSETIPVTD